MDRAIVPVSGNGEQEARTHRSSPCGDLLAALEVAEADED